MTDHSDTFRIKMIGLLWWSRGESMKLRCGSAKPSPAALIRAAFDLFESFRTKKREAQGLSFFWCG